MSFEIQSVHTRFETKYSPFSWLNLKLRYDTDIAGEVYAAIAATVLAVKIGYDVSWHNDYAEKSHEIFKRFMIHARTNNINSLKDPALYTFFNSIDPDFCLTYESWLRSSYDCWFKPWNWTASQKAAYEKMEILSMISLHGPLIILDAQAVEQELVNHARRNCSAVCEYPLVYYGNQLDAHLTALKKGFSVLPYKEAQRLFVELEQELYKLKYILRGNKSYIEECHTLKTHQLLQQAAQNR
jgi:hypothetical protein